MEIVEVTNEAHAQAFLDVQIDLYKKDPNYIRPLDKDVNSVFDKKKNKFFRHGRLKRWLLKKDGKYLGRVAAFVNDRTANASPNKQPTGGMGYFDCVNDQEAANLLFDTCKSWLQEEGMEAMDGPINFGERDKFWGLLVDNFDPPTYNMNYNYPYYQELFENYGFKVYFKQFTYFRKIDEPLPDSYLSKAERVLNDEDFSFRYIDKKDLSKYAEDFRLVYNEAWGGSHKGFKGMRHEQAMSIMKTLKPVMIEDLIWFGYYKGEPVSFFIMLPELNRIFKHVNGKLDLIGKLKFLYHRHVKTTKHVYGVVFGVVPSQRGKGVEGAMVKRCADFVQNKRPYETIEMNWIGDFNPKMIKIVEAIGAEKHRTYHTYRYLFDREKEFERHPMI